MTSYEFEKAAKNAVIQTLSENISIDQLDLVWFAHELGYKKCTIWGQPMGNRYAEVTYNRQGEFRGKKAEYQPKKRGKSKATPTNGR